MIVRIRHDDTLPVVGMINLNERIPVPKEAVVHGQMETMYAKRFHKEIKGLEYKPPEP